jgi:photosystem II PsbW protein
MAAVAATSSAAAVTCFVQKASLSSSHRAAARPVAGLPALRMPKISCSAEKKEKKEEVNGVAQLAAAVTSAATMAYAHPSFALVDERLSGEGTGLGLGISNPRLTWILVGVTALVWAGYFLYSSTLPEGDDDSGLSL